VTHRSSWLDDEVAALRDVAATFLANELMPHFQRSDAQQHVDREVWRKAGGGRSGRVRIGPGGVGGGSDREQAYIVEGLRAEVGEDRVAEVVDPLLG
jgi:acyl-CoA dehydrogenase